MSTIIFVCRGNLCRSPLAASVLQMLLGDDPGFEIRSAGVQALVGSPVDPETAQVAAGLGADVALHVAAQLTPQDMHDAALVLTSGRTERADAVRFYPRAVSRTFTIRQFGRLSAGALAHAPTVDGLRRTSRDARLEALIAAAVGQRGQQKAVRPVDDDVVDPYMRSRAFHERAARQMLPALRTIADALKDETSSL